MPSPPAATCSYYRNMLPQPTQLKRLGSWLRAEGCRGESELSCLERWVTPLDSGVAKREGFIGIEGDESMVIR